MKYLKQFKILLFVITPLIINKVGLAQDEDTLIIYPSAKEIDVNISASINNLTGNLLIYSYELFSSASSKQNVYTFYIEIDSDILQINSPDMWRGTISDVRKKVVSWGSGDSLYDIQPGENLTGFSFTSNDPPKVGKYFSRGYVEVPSVPYGEAPPLQGTKGANIFENSVTGKTLTPWQPDSTLSLQDFTDTLETFRYRACEELDWVTNHGVCNSLEVKIRNVKRHLERGQITQAGNVLDAFLNEVEAQRGKHITEEGYALLYFNARYVRNQLNAQMED